MTISVFDTRRDYTGNGIATFFEFVLPDINDIVGVTVYVDSVLVTNYSLQANGINFTTAPDDGARILIVSAVELNQLRDWVPFGKFPAAKTENAADKLIVLKGGALTYGRYMNLSTLQTIGDVTLVNDKGDDAVTPLWHHTLEEAGMVSVTVAEQIPLDGSPTNTPESHLWISFPEDPLVPTLEYSAEAETGYVLLDSQFTGGYSLVKNRTHPMAGYAEQDITIFGAFRWTPAAASVGALFDIGGLSIDAVRRPLTSQYYIGFTFRRQDGTEIFSNTFELGDIEDPGNDYETGDWLAFAISVSRFDIAPPDGQRNFTAYVANLTKGTEENFSYEPVGTGLLGWDMALDRNQRSRAGILEYMDEDGSLTFLGPVSMMAFEFVYMDLEVQSVRDKIWTLSGMSDHGIAGINVFGKRPAYYSLPGAPSENQGYMNFGDPRLTNPIVYGTGADLPPTNFTPYEHPLADWIYVDMIAAEASGDAWQNDDTVFIREGTQRMKYLTAMDINGHSGLIHVDPHMLDEDFTAISVEDSQAEGTDPQTWGWTLSSAGTEGVDWDADVNSGRARLTAYTNSGAVSLVAPYTLQVGDTSVFAILDRYSGVNNNGTIGQSFTLQSKGAWNIYTSSSSSSIPPTPPTDTHGLRTDVGYANTLQDEQTEKRVWFYQNDDYTSLWDDTGLVLKIPATQSVLLTEIARYIGGTAGENGPQDCHVGYHVIGTMT